MSLSFPIETTGNPYCPYQCLFGIPRDPYCPFLLLFGFCNGTNESIKRVRKHIYKKNVLRKLRFQEFAGNISPLLWRKKTKITLSGPSKDHWNTSGWLAGCQRTWLGWAWLGLLGNGRHELGAGLGHEQPLHSKKRIATGPNKITNESLVAPCKTWS